MANKLITRALMEPVSGAAEKALLISLCNYAKDEHRLCWPSLDTLALNAGIGRTAVKRHLRVLEGLGLVVRVDTSLVPPDESINRRLHPFVYRVYPDPEDVEWCREHFAAAAPASHTGDSLDSHTGDSLDSRTGDPLENPASHTGDRLPSHTGDRLPSHTGDPEPIYEPQMNHIDDDGARARARVDDDREAGWSFAPSPAHRAQAIQLGVDVDAEAAKFVARIRRAGSPPDDPEAAFRSWLAKGAASGLAARRSTPTPPEHSRRPAVHRHRWNCEHVLAAMRPRESEFDHTKRGFGPTSDWDAACDAKARELNHAEGIPEEPE